MLLRVSIAGCTLLAHDKGTGSTLLACCQLAGATTYTVNPAQSTSRIQAIIAAPRREIPVSFTAGTYTIRESLFSQVRHHYTGPVATPGDSYPVLSSWVSAAQYSRE